MSPGLSVQVSAVLCARLEGGIPTCVCWRVAVLCVTVCACFRVTSCFCVCVGVCIAGLWQYVMLSLLVSEHLSVVQLCASVSLRVRQHL